MKKNVKTTETGDVDALLELKLIYFGWNTPKHKLGGCFC